MSEGTARAITVGISDRGIAALEATLAQAGYEPAGRAADGASGLRLIEAMQPELVVAAAIMPGMDGAAFVGRARQLRLSLRPLMVLLKPPGLRIPGEGELPGLGAQVTNQPLSASALRDALASLEAWSKTLPPHKQAQLESLLDALGVPPHPGRDCLARAVALAWHDRRRVRALKDGIYPELARQTGLSPAQAERAIRRVIDAAWDTGKLEQQHRLFGDTIDARRGKPTCGEMIAQLAEELRWEGTTP